MFYNVFLFFPCAMDPSWIALCFCQKTKVEDQPFRFPSSKQVLRVAASSASLSGMSLEHSSSPQISQWDPQRWSAKVSQDPMPSRSLNTGRCSLGDSPQAWCPSANDEALWRQALHLLPASVIPLQSPRVCMLVHRNHQTEGVRSQLEPCLCRIPQSQASDGPNVTLQRTRRKSQKTSYSWNNQL